jgi:hypothetical protein
MLIVLIILLLVFGFGGYRLGPGLGYYGGGGISLIILIVIRPRLARENGDLLRSSSGTSPEEPDQASAENHRLAKQYRVLRVIRRTQW